MSIGPLRLNSVSADSRDPHKLKGCGRKGLRGGFIHVSHNVALAFASGAGAVSAQVLDGDVGLSAVIPFDGQFAADVLNIYGLHDNTMFGQILWTLQDSIG